MKSQMIDTSIIIYIEITSDVLYLGYDNNNLNKGDIISIQYLSNQFTDLSKAIVKRNGDEVKTIALYFHSYNDRMKMKYYPSITIESLYSNEYYEKGKYHRYYENITKQINRENKINKLIK